MAQEIGPMAAAARAGDPDALDTLIQLAANIGEKPEESAVRAQVATVLMGIYSRIGTPPELRANLQQRVISLYEIGQRSLEIQEDGKAMVPGAKKTRDSSPLLSVNLPASLLYVAGQRANQKCQRALAAKLEAEVRKALTPPDGACSVLDLQGSLLDR